MLIEPDLARSFLQLTEQEQTEFVFGLLPRDRQHFWSEMTQAIDNLTEILPPFDVHLEPYQNIEGEDEASIIMFMAGRGAGKTYKGSAWSAHKSEIQLPGMNGLLVAPTFQQCREVMVEGQGSGILDQLGDRVDNYNRSTFEITTKSSSRIYMRSADRPDSIRGLNLAWCWADEVGAWTRPEAWHEGIMPALRIGEHPQAMVTTTPRRVRLVREIYNRYEGGDTAIALGTATMHDNPHLSDFAKSELERVYHGTHLYDQEILGKLIDVVEGAVWRIEWIQRRSRGDVIAGGGMAQVVVGVDPSGSVEGTGDECGIIVSGRGVDGNGYVLDDRTIRGSPGEWSAQIIDAYHSVYGLDALNDQGWKPSYVAIEGDGNMGGLAKELINRIDQHIPIKLVYTRGKSKEDRARPISMMWERGQVFHLGIFDQLEDQMCFPAGTMIETKRGHVPIETVKKGDQVRGRLGWSPVDWAGQTGEASQFVTVTHTEGNLSSTAWHRIWTTTRGFVPASDVQPSDRLVVRPSPANTVTPSHGVADGGIECREAITGTLGSSPKDCFTGPSGKRIEDPSPTGSSSTTSTMTRPTIGSTTSNAFLMPTIDENMRQMIEADSSSGPTRNALLHPEKCGHDVSPVVSSAITAALSSRLRTCGRGGALDAVAGSYAATEPIYDIKVEDGYLHEFFADGVLVHNTGWVPGEIRGYSPDRIDALVWSMTSLFPDWGFGGGPDIRTDDRRLAGRGR